MKSPVILKLGGSLLTEGDRSPRVRRAVLNRIAREIAEASKAHPHLQGGGGGQSGRGRGASPPSPTGLVLVHGAGSFGHGPVERGEPLWAIHRSVLELDRRVCDRLARAGLAPVPVDPFSAGSAAALVRPARLALAAGFLPVLYGDVVAGERPGSYNILSGDRIASVLARSFGARRVGMATDVEGILKDGWPLPVLRRGERVDFFPVEGDVTGAMGGKVRELRALARRGVAAFVFGGKRPGNVRRFLEGRPVGTRIR